jgi:flagellar biosynthesis/type III secretory pathway M-ring protein FliF/YscJ
MFSYDRNVDLEEVKASPFFELDFIKYSSKSQLCLLSCSIISSIVLIVVNSLFLHMESYLATLIMSLPVLVGALFGCQYNQDLSYYEYIKCLVTKQKKTYYKKSTEDILSSKETIKLFLEEKSAEKEQLQKKNEKKRKILLITSIFILIAIVIAFLYISTRPTQELYQNNNTLEESIE